MDSNNNSGGTKKEASSEKPSASQPSNLLKIIIFSVGTLLLAILIFSGGVAVGLKKARFSYHWGENYERNFLGRGGFPGSGMMGLEHDAPHGIGDRFRGMARDFSGQDFRNAHGIAGTIVSINGSNIVVKDQNNQESTVTVTDQTVIRKFRESIGLGDLKANDRVVVLGRPSEDGTVSADLIRVFENVQPSSTNNNQDNSQNG